MLRAAHTTWRTDTGRQRRGNEDSAFARAPLFVIADGMGGAQAGEVASRIAVEAFQGDLPEQGSAEERLTSVVQAANRRIYDISRTEHERAGMGTTLTAVYVDGAELAVAHVGDSRAYLFRDGELELLTQDHTLVGELVKRGKLTEEQAAEHPQRSIITRALGIDADVEVDTWTYSGRAGDVVLLCSDGLTSMISEDQITDILTHESNLDTAAARLIDEANEAGGRDNITVILFTLEEVGGDGAVDEPTVVGIAPPVGPEAGAVGAGTVAAAQSTPVVAPPPSTPPPKTGRRAVPARLARTQGQRTRGGDGRSGRRRHRFGKAFAALVATLVVVFLVGGGGYLATRQLFFVGTNGQGIVTIYRGLPYTLPFGIPMYETFYVSGVPIQFVPSQRRSEILNHDLRSQASAISLVHAAELGQLTP
ncbi:MAG: Stp1/IreP family PP2C-type Ser/Thr phosphatase [Solirubrobacteraceae bacterium]